jgi:hypothetical protein
MTPTPLPTATVTATATVTTTPPPAPIDGPSLPDQLQGWGTMLAIVVTLGTVWWTNRKPAKDQAAQFAEFRDRARAAVLVEQLQEIADMYADRAHEGAVRPLLARGSLHPVTAIMRARLAAVPGKYASLLKAIDTSDTVKLLYSETARLEAERRTAAHGIDRFGVQPYMIYTGIAGNIAELIGEADAGRS